MLKQLCTKVVPRCANSCICICITDDHAYFNHHTSPEAASCTVSAESVTARSGEDQVAELQAKVQQLEQKVCLLKHRIAIIVF